MSITGTQYHGKWGTSAQSTDSLCCSQPWFLHHHHVRSYITPLQPRHFTQKPSVVYLKLLLLFCFSFVIPTNKNRRGIHFTHKSEGHLPVFTLSATWKYVKMAHPCKPLWVWRKWNKIDTCMVIAQQLYALKVKFCLKVLLILTWTWLNWQSWGFSLLKHIEWLIKAKLKQPFRTKKPLSSTFCSEMD